MTQADQNTRNAMDALRHCAAARDSFLFQEFVDSVSDFSAVDADAACMVLMREGELFTHQIELNGHRRTVLSRHRVLPATT